MNYKELYKELANDLTNLGCCICDHDFLGYCCQVGSLKAFIFIKPSLSYKEKYFILAHESGHLFYMTKGKLFKRAKKNRTEEQANWFAIQLLRINGVEVYEYKNFYSHAKKIVKNRIKSWHEI